MNNIFTVIEDMGNLRENNNFLKRGIRRMARNISKNMSKTEDLELKKEMYFAYLGTVALGSFININA